MRFLFRLVLKYVGLVGWLLMATCNAAGIKPVSYHFAIFNIYSKVNTLASFPAKRSALENPRETIGKGSYTATEDSLSLVPDGPPGDPGWTALMRRPSSASSSRLPVWRLPATRL